MSRPERQIKAVIKSGEAAGVPDKVIRTVKKYDYTNRNADRYPGFLF